LTTVTLSAVYSLFSGRGGADEEEDVLEGLGGTGEAEEEAEEEEWPGRAWVVEEDGWEVASDAVAVDADDEPPEAMS
jgi:hypothetical protein